MAFVTVDRSSPLGESKARDIARAEAAESLKCSGDSGLPALPPIIVTAARSTSELSVFAKDTNDKADLSAKEGQNTDDASNDELCETPKSEEHRIPEVISCPPAPRKPRPTLGIKRKASLSPRKLYIPPDLELLFANSKNPNSQRRAKETRTALRI